MADIAAALDMNANTAKTRLRRGRRAAGRDRPGGGHGRLRLAARDRRPADARRRGGAGAERDVQRHQAERNSRAEVRRRRAAVRLYPGHHRPGARDRADLAVLGRSPRRRTPHHALLRQRNLHSRVPAALRQSGRTAPGKAALQPQPHRRRNGGLRPGRPISQRRADTRHR